MRADAKQADPVGEARVRIRTFEERGKVIAPSTPSTADGPVAVGFEACPMGLFLLRARCPHCGGGCSRSSGIGLGLRNSRNWGRSRRGRRASRRRKRPGWNVKTRRVVRRIVESDQRKRKKSRRSSSDISGRCSSRVTGEPKMGDGKLWFDGREDGEQPEGDSDRGVSAGVV